MAVNLMKVILMFYVINLFITLASIPMEDTDWQGYTSHDNITNFGIVEEVANDQEDYQNAITNETGQGESSDNELSKIVNVGRTWKLVAKIIIPAAWIDFKSYEDLGQEQRESMGNPDVIEPVYEFVRYSMLAFNTLLWLVIVIVLAGRFIFKADI